MIIRRQSWRCYFCDEVFTDKIEATAHFGGDQIAEPGCVIKDSELGLLGTIREQEHELSRYRAEDSDKDRAMYGMAVDHRQALVREEEKGYARGLKDCNAHWRRWRDAPRDGQWFIAACNDHTAICRLKWNGQWWETPEGDTYGDGLFSGNGGWVPCPQSEEVA
jgi:hypothetical protein